MVRCPQTFGNRVYIFSPSCSADKPAKQMIFDTPEDFFFLLINLIGNLFGQTKCQLIFCIFKVVANLQTEETSKMWM